MGGNGDFIGIDGHRLEYRAIGVARAGLPTLVFLHQGLGSVSMWRDFPDALAARTGCAALLYSRAGYGWSNPPPAPFRPDFMLEEARTTLPALLAALGLDDVILVGHSDGGTIALAYLALGNPARGAIVAAPHVLIEDVTWQSIARQRTQWADGELRRRLARHHRDPSGMFRQWADAWLAPEFRAWSMIDLLPTITRPLLAVQGVDDEYGTMRQIDEIARHASGPVRLEKLAQCGHDPFRDQPERMLALGADFIAGLT